MVNGNLAYKKQTVTKPIRPKRTDINKEKDNTEMIRKRVTFLRILYIGVIAASAAFMISKFVSVNETASQIKSLNKELSQIRSYTSQKIFEMERKVDLSEVEEIASTRLGMQRPEGYQTIYVDVPQEDKTEVTAGEVEGAKNSIKSLWGGLKKNIIEFFSIK